MVVLQMRKMIMPGIWPWPFILLFLYCLPIKVKSSDWSQTVSQYTSDFSSADQYDTPKCKIRGKMCKTGDCCHMYTCEESNGFSRCVTSHHNVLFPDWLMRKISPLPCVKEGGNCENDICCSGLRCYILTGTREFKRRCMTTYKRLPPPPCVQEGKDCKTGQCCEGKVCQAQDDGTKKCMVEKRNANDAPTALTVPVKQESKCLGVGERCHPGQCCMNLICDTSNGENENGICKTMDLIEGFWITRMFYFV